MTIKINNISLYKLLFIISFLYIAIITIKKTMTK
jgi:hypothetical protein